jgi:hypothetical protein
LDSIRHDLQTSEKKRRQLVEEMRVNEERYSAKKNKFDRGGDLEEDSLN